ncbi:MAG: hypothetical protein R3C24_02785 [Cyanobacteriota/Melainabacteria group bacterium]
MTQSTLTRSTEADSATEINRKTPDSIRQPVWHVAVLGFFSFGLYLIYWFHKTWSTLKAHALTLEEKGLKKSGDNEFPVQTYARSRPWLKTLAFFVPMLCSPLGYTPIAPVVALALKFVYPVVMLFLFANLFKDIASMIPDKGADSSWAKTNSIQAGFVLGMAIPFCLVLAGANGMAYLLYLLVVIPVSVAQGWLNQYWEHWETKELGEVKALRTAFTPLETILIIVGALGLGMVMFTPN